MAGQESPRKPRFLVNVTVETPGAVETGRKPPKDLEKRATNVSPSKVDDDAEGQEGTDRRIERKKKDGKEKKN